MTPEQQLELMRSPHRWPLRLVLALAHATDVDSWGIARCAFLAFGHHATLYRGLVSDFAPGETLKRARFEAALTRFPSVRYVSFEALFADGWRVD